MVFLQLFANGLQLGAIYALTAVGFSLIFGSTKIFHVAHGSAFAISGYIYWWLASKLNVSWPIACCFCQSNLRSMAMCLVSILRERIQFTGGSFSVSSSGRNANICIGLA